MLNQWLEQYSFRTRHPKLLMLVCLQWLFPIEHNLLLRRLVVDSREGSPRVRNCGLTPSLPSLLQGHYLCHRAMFLRETLLDDPSNDQLLWRPLPCYLLACISLEHVYQAELLWIQD